MEDILLVCASSLDGVVVERAWSLRVTRFPSVAAWGHERKPNMIGRMWGNSTIVIELVLVTVACPGP